MSVFQCENCGCAENTACGWYWSKDADFSTDNRELCSVCAPTTFKSGEPTGLGKWHGRFKRTFYPIGTKMTCPKTGNLIDISPATKKEGI